MSKYLVTVKRVVSEKVSVEVDATTLEEAIANANALADECVDGDNWYCCACEYLTGLDDVQEIMRRATPQDH